jgi:hypothetical protein
VSAANGNGRPRRHRPPEPIGDAWRTFVRALDGATWSPVQHDEMRKSFFAGALSAFRFMLRANSPAELDVLSEEFNRYVASLRSDGKETAC